MIFIDTGAFVARFRAADDYHSVSINAWATLKRSNVPLFTSNLVLLESAKVLGDLKGHVWASDRLGEWLSSTEMKTLYSDRDAELAGAEIMERFADQGIGPIDCVNMALMRRYRIKKCFAFDRHFKIAGFELWPEK